MEKKRNFCCLKAFFRIMQKNIYYIIGLRGECGSFSSTLTTRSITGMSLLSRDQLIYKLVSIDSTLLMQSS